MNALFRIVERSEGLQRIFKYLNFNKDINCLSHQNKVWRVYSKSSSAGPVPVLPPDRQVTQSVAWTFFGFLPFILQKKKNRLTNSFLLEEKER